MKKIVTFLTVLALLSLIEASLVAHATTYFPFIEEHSRLKEKAVMKVGAVLYLFHSNTRDVKKTIAVKDILVVYRENSSCELREVGKIKVLSFANENYVKGEVVEGEATLDDIAKKGATTLLVTVPVGRCGH
jgi:hypothetical protein